MVAMNIYCATSLAPWIASRCMQKHDGRKESFLPLNGLLESLCMSVYV